ncbi:SLOG domain-containing protein [Flagellimonas zhangzhouensis]|uniref:Uncharacterized protein n=1 Tax=Flagellimonas zhangzhouensis TaxID=1073328 RepID=A0A1H2WQL8_9FLAO|nr:hypothetical protein [Allomuricauda zhangzhouensis]SDQ23673.1 hypothetical protein SAMN05216294_1008 [Allomuricauda zhangzhouensis]SDW82855.1 hypothetical protein SAMN04487892_2388 [Allomuricauda zhangzhouensis]
MAKKQLENIFLSASIPLPERDEKYQANCDVIAIRDAVIALVTTILPHYRLIWGGHPSITPLIYHVMQKMEINIQEHLTLYQSDFFSQFYPEDNNKFKNVIITPRGADRDSSLEIMRQRMIAGNQYRAGIFIGGMEGVEDEHNMFLKNHAASLVLPIASTGAAAKIIYERNSYAPDTRLLEDYAYASLFRDYLLNDNSNNYGEEGIYQL